jgi:hypothetical protein
VSEAFGIVLAVLSILGGISQIVQARREARERPPAALTVPRWLDLATPWLVGAWQLFLVLAGIAWLADPSTGGDTPAAEVPGVLRTAALMLASSALWAGLLAWRNFRHRTGVRRRAYVYLMWTVLGLGLAVALLLRG